MVGAEVKDIALVCPDDEAYISIQINMRIACKWLDMLLCIMILIDNRILYPALMAFYRFVNGWCAAVFVILHSLEESISAEAKSVVSFVKTPPSLNVFIDDGFPLAHEYAA